jgi:hypothetical protein
MKVATASLRKPGRRKASLRGAKYGADKEKTGEELVRTVGFRPLDETTECDEENQPHDVRPATTPS